MSLFDRLVDEALRARADLSSLRPVVEKELLHHDILREMSEAGLLVGLTFIGRTCLRACYGSSQLSERENRIKNRDLWDIAWLAQQGIDLPSHLIPVKIRDHNHEATAFVAMLDARLASLREQPEVRASFIEEMRRFLPVAVVRDTIEKGPYWSYLTDIVTDLGRKARAALPAAAGRTGKRRG